MSSRYPTLIARWQAARAAAISAELSLATDYQAYFHGDASRPNANAQEAAASLRAREQAQLAAVVRYLDERDL